MNLIDLILLSLALGIDCFVVSFSQGLVFKSQRVKNSLNLAFTMGIFQGFMPLVGYFATSKVYNILLPYSKLIVFSIFLALGIHFIFNAYAKEKDLQIQCIGLRCLILLGIATSIDAMVSGISLSLTNSNLLVAVLLIGIGSFVMSMVGFWGANIIKNINEKYLKILAGVILVILAIKSFV